MKKGLIKVSIGISGFILLIIIHIIIQDSKIDNVEVNELENYTNNKINRPTLYLEDEYYQYARLETIVEPEHISLIGTITSTSENNKLPVNYFETNYDKYFGYEIYTTNQSDVIYLKHTDEHNNSIYSKWYLSNPVIVEPFPADWYPSVMINDNIYSGSLEIVNQVPTEYNYEIIGRILYEESFCTMNYSNSLGMLGADIYYSENNKKVIYVGYQDGQLMKLYLEE